MKDECLICSAPLVYLEADEEMQCAVCGQKYFSKTRCVNGHYVCDDCHTKGWITLSVCAFRVNPKTRWKSYRP